MYTVSRKELVNDAKYICSKYIISPLCYIKYSVSNGIDKMKMLRYEYNKRKQQQQLYNKYVQYTIEQKVKQKKLYVEILKKLGPITANIIVNPITSRLMQTYLAMKILSNPIVIQKIMLAILPAATSTACTTLVLQGMLYVCIRNGKRIYHFFKHNPSSAVRSIEYYNENCINESEV